jgi:cell division protein FtsL
MYYFEFILIIIIAILSGYSIYQKYKNIKLYEENEWLKFGLGEYELKQRKLKEEITELKKVNK